MQLAVDHETVLLTMALLLAVAPPLPVSPSHPALWRGFYLGPRGEGGRCAKREKKPAVTENGSYVAMLRARPVVAAR
jgi:hypothetical protein